MAKKPTKEGIREESVERKRWKAKERERERESREREQRGLSG